MITTQVQPAPPVATFTRTDAARGGATPCIIPKRPFYPGVVAITPAGAGDAEQVTLPHIPEPPPAPPTVPTDPDPAPQSMLYRLAERVARNREVMGLHYPSDTRAGQIWRRVSLTFYCRSTDIPLPDASNPPTAITTMRHHKFGARRMGFLRSH